MKLSRVRNLAATAMLVLAAGYASAQDLPGIPTGPAIEDFSLPTPPGAETQRIGGVPAGTFLFTPPANLTNLSVSDSNAGVLSALDSTSEGSMQYSQGGRSSPVSPASSTWSASGFQSPAARQGYSSSRFGSTRSDLSMRNSRRFGQDSSTPGQTRMQGGENDLSPFPLSYFSSGSDKDSLAGSSSMKSDIPDLTPPPGSFGQVSPVLSGAAPSMASSIQPLGFSYESYGLSSRSPSSLGPRRRNYNTLHDRLAARSPGSTLRSRNASRLHTRLRDR
ncbi:MAG TPA: hypothetical protein VGD64_09810 [Acidisarcina sp.]